MNSIQHFSDKIFIIGNKQGRCTK